MTEILVPTTFRQGTVPRIGFQLYRTVQILVAQSGFPDDENETIDY